MDPNLGFAHWLLGLAYMYKGTYEPAIQELQKSIPLSGDSPDEPASLGLAYALAGKSGEARKIMEELKQRSKRKYLSSIPIATLHAALGEKDQALDWLEKDARERTAFEINFIKVDPFLDPLRGDPRFEALVSRILSSSVN